MKSVCIFIFAIFGAALAQDCFPQCKFKFCGGNDQWTVGISDRPFTDQICLDGVKLGQGATSGEPLIGTMPAKPISTAALPGLTTMYSPSFVKTVSFKHGSALAHETPQGNQVDFLEDLCVKVPIKTYTIKKEGIIENVVASNAETDCISLITELPDAIVTMPDPVASTETIPAPSDIPI